MRAALTVSILALTALASFACSSGAATPSATPAAVVSSSPKASLAAATPTATVAPAASPSAPTGTIVPGDAVTGVGKTTAIDLAADQFSMLVSASNPAVNNKVVTFRIDSSSTLTMFQKGGPGTNVRTVADFGPYLQVGTMGGISFKLSSYDPATKTYLIRVIQINGF